MYNSLNLDDHNSETHELLAGIPGKNAYCQIGIGTDTLSIGVDMLVIADGIIISGIDDSDEAFQKFGQLAWHSGLISNPRGIVYTTPAILKVAEQVMTIAEYNKVDSSKSPTPLTDISWPTMLIAKCKSEGQHKLYNKGINYIACLCKLCILLSPPLINNNCNCSRCILENIPAILKSPLPPTDLSQILTKDHISTSTQAHSVATLTKFHKDVWCTDKSNLLLHPEVYLSDHLMKEILDKFSLLKSLKAVAEILVPYKCLKNEEHALFDILTTLQADFNNPAVEKKAETAVKCKAITTAKAMQRDMVQVKEIGPQSDDEYMDGKAGDVGVADQQDADVRLNIAGPSHQQAP